MCVCQQISSEQQGWCLSLKVSDEDSLLVLTSASIFTEGKGEFNVFWPSTYDSGQGLSFAEYLLLGISTREGCLISASVKLLPFSLAIHRQRAHVAHQREDNVLKWTQMHCGPTALSTTYIQLELQCQTVFFANFNGHSVNALVFELALSVLRHIKWTTETRRCCS